MTFQQIRTLCINTGYLTSDDLRIKELSDEAIQLLSDIKNMIFILLGCIRNGVSIEIC